MSGRLCLTCAVCRQVQRIGDNFDPVSTTVDTARQGRFRSEISDKVVHVHIMKASGGMEIWLHLFLILARGGSCGKLRAMAAHFLGEDIPVPIVQRAGWVPGPVSTS